MNAHAANNPAECAVPLATVAPGRQVRFVRADGDRGLVARLAAMGLVPGAAFRVVSTAGRGPFVIAIRDSRIALGRGMAHNIYVQ